jgi:very-short-patch-repair endonuclease
MVLPPHAAFTHLTAAEQFGWWLPERVPWPVFAAAAQDDTIPVRPGLLVSRHAPRLDSVVVDELRPTTPAETLLAAARDLGVLDLVILGDSALRLRHCTLADLQLVASQRRRGVRMLRTVIPLLDERSESPWESVMRVLHQAADIEVEPQHKIFDQWGCFVARADLLITGTRRIHEYDGGGHREADTHVADLDRDRRLVEAGWQRCGFTARSVLREGGATIASVDRLLGRGWDPRRLARWNSLVADSLFGPIGRVRVRRRWSAALTRGNQPTNCGVGTVAGRELGSQVAS